ncbi:hypothetical protein B0A69_18805 [Chryseobacterium shigense]|uniref:Uncharacterized protein n=1 Tax=Chryseobacterium shigense TaxID=297244 RepID=A0A1N7HYI4_9FLAO|nr:hypothetical protein [Chryseobacterium shigense]PQA90790.1 hypothetical protein B0A69_18805 [Chryseobacterium shigense]SIS29821.1 hypothetical protein SAMN05421639_101624 [Chryseobacterium shigense]
MQKTTLLLILGFFSLTNCKKSNTDANINLDTLVLNNDHEIDSLKMYGFNDSNLDKKIYEIKGENIFLRDGPGKKYNKLINQKATDIIGETQYMQVDYTCTISIEQEKNNWAKVRIVEPSHLSATHYGWIPLQNIIKDDSQIPSVNLSQLKYEIISTTENNISKNYNIYLDINNLSKDEISSFVKKFREKNCSVCTISIFDTKSIKNLIDIYPLSKSEYLRFADHFVAWSTFDVPKLVSFYPFQDSKYKEYGGKNFKEQKMK